MYRIKYFVFVNKTEWTPTESEKRKITHQTPHYAYRSVRRKGAFVFQLCAKLISLCAWGDKRWQFLKYLRY